MKLTVAAIILLASFQLVLPAASRRLFSELPGHIRHLRKSSRNRYYLANRRDPTGRTTDITRGNWPEL